MMLSENESPCLTCKAVKYPEYCDNKHCPVWRYWFADIWEQTRKLWEGLKNQKL